MSTGMRYTGKVSPSRGIRVSYVEQEPPAPSGTMLMLFGEQNLTQNNKM